MAEGVYFPARIERMDHSQDYYELKERIVQLDRKLETWLGGFDRRLSRIEAKTAKTKGAQVPKKAVKKT